MAYFFDTSAIIELIKGNPRFQKYEDEQIVCSLLNVCELYLYHLRFFNRQTAEYWRQKLSAKILELDEASVVKAAEFKFAHQKQNFSIVDCTGYILALRHGLKFLTSDSSFKKVVSAEFVPKS